MEKRQPWTTWGLAMIEIIFIIFMITGAFVWGLIFFTIIKIWMEK
jgi:hypothetical protein